MGLPRRSFIVSENQLLIPYFKYRNDYHTELETNYRTKDIRQTSLDLFLAIYGILNI